MKKKFSLNTIFPFIKKRFMIDINLLRVEKGGNPDLVKESQRKRGGQKAVDLIDEIMTLDQEWIKAQFSTNEMNREINKIAKELGMFAKNKKMDSPPALELKLKKDDLMKEKMELTLNSEEKEKLLFRKLKLVGNIVHHNVVDSNTEDDNKVIYKWWPSFKSEDGELKRRSELIKDKGVPGLYSHHEVLEKIGGYDPVRGSKVAGHRGYFLTGPGVDLNLALMQYGLNFLESKGYTKLWTPFFMKKEEMAKTAQLEEFDEALYGVTGETEEKYLIATSEQPISCMHSNEFFSENDASLPIKYAGTSTCFRKEAGAHGRDTWGIYRVHQFEKIEQFVLCHPDKSWEMHEEMLNVSREFYESLGIPYRVISIVSGALNNAASAKYDLEGYFPFQGVYKELVSCSNCTDYQTRELEIRLGVRKVFIINI